MRNGKPVRDDECRQNERKKKTKQKSQRADLAGGGIVRTLCGGCGEQIMNLVRGVDPKPKGESGCRD